MDLILRKFPNNKWLLPLLSMLALLCAVNSIRSCRNHLTYYRFPQGNASALLLPAREGEFNVLTYNIAGLPEPLSSAVSRREPSIAEIGRKLRAFDIVHVQEDFNYNKQLYGETHSHPYRTPSKGVVPFGDGLNTLSKYPISELRRIPWTDCTGADCLTPKGFTFSRIQITDGIFIDFYNVHANAANYPAAAAARRKNILQLSAYIKTHSQHNAAVVMGDLNAHYHFQADNVTQLLTVNGLQDAWLILFRNGQLPQPTPQLPDDEILQLTDSCESIDKILFRSSKQLLLQPRHYELKKSLFTNKLGQSLSDHCPVGLSFYWNLKK